jgi:hypothetical protein
MSHLENFDHPLKKHNKGFFVHLVKIAMADGIIWYTELELLHQVGKLTITKCVLQVLLQKNLVLKKVKSRHYWL